MSDGGRLIGRRQSDTNPDYMQQLEACLARVEKEAVLLSAEVVRLKELIRVKDAELAKLRQRQADVLTEAIKQGFDGIPRPSEETPPENEK